MRKAKCSVEYRFSYSGPCEVQRSLSLLPFTLFHGKFSPSLPSSHLCHISHLTSASQDAVSVITNTHITKVREREKETGDMETPGPGRGKFGGPTYAAMDCERFQRSICDWYLMFSICFLRVSLSISLLELCILFKMWVISFLFYPSAHPNFTKGGPERDVARERLLLGSLP